MYKLLLCDDDQIVLEGLKTWVQATHPEIELVGCATNGNQAKLLVDQHKPHILITDICMPFMTGLQLIEYARTLNPFLRSIIISGYDDFRYARKAVQLGAIDFVLKPIDVEELDRLLVTAVADCAQAERTHELARRSALKRILDAPEGADLSAMLAQAELPLRDCYQIVILENEKYMTDNLESLDECRYGIYKEFNQLADQVKAFGSIITNSYSNMVICLHGGNLPTLQSLRSQIEALVRRHNSVDRQKHFITMAIGLSCRGLAGIQKSYTEALAVMGYKFILDSDILAYGSIRDQNLPAIRDDLISTEAFSLGNLSSHKAIDSSIANLKASLEEQKCGSSLYLGMLISNICVNLSKELNNCGVKLSDIFETPFSELQKVLITAGFQEKLEALRIFLYRIQDYMAPYNQHKHAKAIHLALDYIHAHYAEPALSMESTAQSVFMSTNYFSTVFKEQTGQTFTNYLIDYRVERAKYLIEHTNYLFYEISTMVGYPNAPYFSSLFKKKTGYSPSEYKARTSKP